MKALIVSLAIIILFSFFLMYQTDTNAYMRERESIRSDIHSVSEGLSMIAYSDDSIAIGKKTIDITQEDIERYIINIICRPRGIKDGTIPFKYSVYIADEDGIHLFNGRNGNKGLLLDFNDEVYLLDGSKVIAASIISPLRDELVSNYRERKFGVVVEVEWLFKRGKIRAFIVPRSMQNIIRQSSTVYWTPTIK